MIRPVIKTFKSQQAFDCWLKRLYKKSVHVNLTVQFFRQDFGKGVVFYVNVQGCHEYKKEEVSRESKIQKKV